MTGYETFKAGLDKGDMEALKQSVRQSPKHQLILERMKQHPELFTLWSESAMLLFAHYCVNPNIELPASRETEFDDKLKVLQQDG